MAASPWSIQGPDHSNTLAIEDDGWWFHHHPNRTMRVRPSLPFELDGWGPLTHLQMNWIVVRVERCDGPKRFSRYERFGVIFAGTIPDDEAVIGGICRHHDERKEQRGDGTYYLSADEHRQALGKEPRQ